jgi:hypothetical protein
LREVLKLLGQEPLVPLGVFGESVVRDRQGSAFRLAETIDHDRWDLAPAELATGHDPTMAGDHIALAIDESRDGEAEGLDRAGELLDLLACVLAWIARIGLQIVNPAVDDFEAVAPPLGHLPCVGNFVIHYSLSY